MKLVQIMKKLNLVIFLGRKNISSLIRILNSKIKHVKQISLLCMHYYQRNETFFKEIVVFLEDFHSIVEKNPSITNKINEKKYKKEIVFARIICKLNMKK